MVSPAGRARVLLPYRPLGIEVRVRSRLLVSLLGVCAVVAVWPLGVWLIARLFEPVGDHWMDTVSVVGVTVPIALAMAALILVVHGIKRNAQLQLEAAEEAEERVRLMALQLAPATEVGAGWVAAPRVASVSASGAAVATATTSAPSGALPRTAADAEGDTVEVHDVKGKPKPPAVVSKGKKRAQAMAKKQVRQSFRGLRR